MAASKRAIVLASSVVVTCPDCGAEQPSPGNGWFVLGACALSNGFQWLVRYVWARIDLLWPWGGGRV